MSTDADEARKTAALGLERMDEVLEKRPHKDGKLIAEATRALTAYRKDLIARSRSGTPEDRRRLERLNAVLSVTAGLHFPLGEPPWDEFGKARAWLKDILDEDAAAAGGGTQTASASRH